MLSRFVRIQGATKVWWKLKGVTEKVTYTQQKTCIALSYLLCFPTFENYSISSYYCFFQTIFHDAASGRGAVAISIIFVEVQKISTIWNDHVYKIGCKKNSKASLLRFMLLQRVYWISNYFQYWIKQQTMSQVAYSEKTIIFET